MNYSIKVPNVAKSLNTSSLKKIKFPRIPFNKGLFFKILGIIGIFILIILVASYFLVVRPVMAIAKEAKAVKDSTYQIQSGLKNLSFTEIETGLNNTKEELSKFEEVYSKNMKLIRKFPGTEGYYADSQHMLTAAKQGIELGEVVIGMLKPYASDLGFSVNGSSGSDMPAQDRIVKLLKLMPQFSSEVGKISEKVNSINSELGQIDASRYPEKVPPIIQKLGFKSELNPREEILSVQSVSKELAEKAPQLESLFNAIPEFMGLNEPKKYLVLMANNYEARMAGGFNTYIVAVEFTQGIPQITYSIDTYFIDEGDRTGSSFLVNRNVPYFLRNYLYIQDRGGRLYARDATSTSADFPTAVDTLLTGFWRKDKSLPQDIDGVFQINNDVAVDILKAVGPVSTDKFSVKTDQKNYITIPVTEFNSDNVIQELENIAGGKLAETIGRKEIIKFLAQSIFEKIFTSEATNLVNIANVALTSLSKKDVMLYSFDPNVQKAFEDLGYGGRISPTLDNTWDYLHVSRNNYGSGKADWTKEGFVTQKVVKDVQIKDGKKIGTVEVTIHNPKRPDWYNIDPCCFYNAYMQIYVPTGSKLISATASDGQDIKAAEYTDEKLNKTYFESYSKQLKETDLTLTYTYELPDTVNVDEYKLLIQRQSGITSDPYSVSLGDQKEEFLLSSDKIVRF